MAWTFNKEETSSLWSQLHARNRPPGRFIGLRTTQEGMLSNPQGPKHLKRLTVVTSDTGMHQKKIQADSGPSTKSRWYSKQFQVSASNQDYITSSIKNQPKTLALCILLVVLSLPQPRVLFTTFTSFHCHIKWNSLQLCNELLGSDAWYIAEIDVDFSDPRLKGCERVVIRYYQVNSLQE